MVTRRRLGVLAVAGLAATIFAIPVDAQQQPVPTARFEVRSVTPWVADGGTFTVALGLIGAPLDASLRVTVRQPFAGTESEVRDDILASFDGSLTTDPLREPETSLVGDLVEPGSDQVTLELTVRSTRTGDGRILLPQPGVHPVEIDLVDSDGTELDSDIVYLNHLPPPDDAEPHMAVSVIAEAHAPPLFDAEGAVDDIALARSEVSLLSRIAQIGGFRHLGVSVDPQLLVALASSPDPDDAALIDILRSLLTDFEVLASPWVPPATEAWTATGRSRTLATSLKEGRDAVASHVDKAVDGRIWPPDPTLGPASPPVLSRLGVDRLIVGSTRWDRSVLPRGRTGYVGSFDIDAGESALTAMSPDPEVEDLFVPGSGQPELRAHRAVTLLAAGALATSRRPSAAVFSIDTDVDTDVLDSFMAAFGPGVELDGDLLSMVTPSEAFEMARPLTEDEVPIVSSLRPRRDTPDLDSAEQVLAALRTRSAAQASMLPFGDPESTDIANMLNSVQHRLLTDRDVTARLDTADAAINSFVEAISMPRARQVNVTSRETTIPLRFQNSSDRTLEARLMLSSPQLEFPEGSESLISLEPGANRIDVPTNVRASGEFVIDMALMSPDGSLLLAERRQRVRSTAFSGVGLVLSGGALMFLIVWWYRTLKARDEEHDLHGGQPEEN